MIDIELLKSEINSFLQNLLLSLIFLAAICLELIGALFNNFLHERFMLQLEPNFPCVR